MEMEPSSSSVVSELEGTLLKNPDLFSYFMLVAFESSSLSLLRFTLLLLLRPLLRLLEASGMGGSALTIMGFVSLVGMRESEVAAVARAVLPKFYMEDVDEEAWRVFSSHGRRVVVTRAPRVMAEVFVKKHLQASEVIGSELVVGPFGYVLGVYRSRTRSVEDRVTGLFDKPPTLGMGRPASASFLHLCKEQLHPPFTHNHHTTDDTQPISRPTPVIFHDGRLVKRPTPLTSLLILLWLPLGITLATIRITIGLVLPFSIIPIVTPLFGGKVIVKGTPPPPVTGKNSAGVLFVCTHRTLMDPVVLSTVLGRQIPAVTYSLSRFSEILSPIPTVRLTRIREVDAEKIKHQLAKGDLVVCPEGTTCREPFLLRFSALFAELTDRIVPVAMDYRVGFFHATTARGWKALDPIFFMMNPRPIYEVTFLNQLPAEITCSSGKSPHDVANHVQRMLAATLGFECTNFTRKDKYEVLAGNDGTVSVGGSWCEQVRKFVKTRKPIIFH